MTVLIVEGEAHQFVTTDGVVKLCYVTNIATGLSIPVICCSHYENTGGSAVLTHYISIIRGWYRYCTCIMPLP